MVGGKFGFIDKSGKEIIPFLFDNATGFSDGLASVASEGKEGFIDPTGKVVIPFMYDRTCAFQQGLAFVKKDGKCGYVNASGQAVIPLIYDDADYYFKNALAAVKQADLYGYIDRTGKLIVPCQYKNAHGFNEGLASVQLGDKWGFIDTTGTLVIDARYDYAGFFTDGVAEVKFEGKDMKISRNDKSIFEKKAVAVNAGQEKNVPKLTDAEEEELVRQMLQLNKAHKGPLFEKVNELNNALKPTMIVNSKGEINRQQWRSRALELKKSSLPEAQKQAEAYEKELAALPAGVQQLDLHLAITAYLQEVNRFIKSCDAWADLIYEIVADAEQVSEMMQHIETQLQSMNLGYHFLNKLTEEYALSKSKTGKYLTTMKAAK